MRRRALAISFVMVAAVLFGCGSKELSREQATEMLKQTIGVFVPIEWSVTEERICVGENRLFANANTQEIPREARSLEAAGLVAIRKLNASDRSCMAFWGAYYYQIQLTEKGRAESKNWRRGDGGSYVVEVGKPTKLEVTGLTKNEDASLRAEYFMIYQPTEIGKSLGYSFRRLDTTATFKLSGDGWRITDDGTQHFNFPRQ